jgi:hypothetical protein
MTITSKMGVATLAFSLLAGGGLASANCVPQADMTALRVAALRQQLMVAGLTCRDSAAFNRFVTSYQGELQKSDQALLSFFARQEGGKGDDAYNAYKTKLANRMSMSSLNDPQFCGMAAAAFHGGLARDVPLSAVVSEQQFPIAIGYSSCTRDSSDIVREADAAPVTHDNRRSSAWQRVAMNQAPGEDARDAEQAPPSDGYAPDEYNNDSGRDDSHSRRAEKRRELRAEREDANDEGDDAQSYADRDPGQMRESPPGYDRGERYANARDDSDDRDDDGPYANDGPAFYGNPYDAPYGYGPPPPPPDRWRGGW